MTDNLPGAEKPPNRNLTGFAKIPAKPPVLMLMQAWRDIPGYQQDSQMAHLQLVAVHRPELVTSIDSEMLKTRWFFLYEVQTLQLLSTLRFPVPGDRLLIYNVQPELQLLLKTDTEIAVRSIQSIYVESLLDSERHTAQALKRDPSSRN